jgi:hypothetical protein
LQDVSLNNLFNKRELAPGLLWFVDLKVKEFCRVIDIRAYPKRAVFENNILSYDP